MRPKEVTDFWLGAEALTTMEALQERLRFWTMGDKLDAPVREKFGGALERALSGELDHWLETLQGRVALIILLDQFTRHIHRGTVKQYSGDPKALSIARELHDSGDDRKLEITERAWVCMPFGHHEDQASMERFVSIVDRIKEDGPPEWAPFLDIHCKQARKGLSVITRFGRFPFRNEILGRESTAEEVAFLSEYQHAPNLVHLGI